MLCVVFCVGTFGMNFQLTSALMAQQEFGLGPQEYGLLGTFMAVGSLAGALVAARRARAPSGRFVVGMALVFGAVEIGRRSDADVLRASPRSFRCWGWPPC